jgi:hypothetical protein
MKKKEMNANLLSLLLLRKEEAASSASAIEERVIYLN